MEALSLAHPGTIEAGMRESLQCLGARIEALRLGPMAHQGRCTPVAVDVRRNDRSARPDRQSAAARDGRADEGEYTLALVGAVISLPD
jgi:hypothetical protein